MRIDFCSGSEITVILRFFFDDIVGDRIVGLKCNFGLELAERKKSFVKRRIFQILKNLN